MTHRGGGTVQLVLDPSACDGFGFCAEILPEVMDLDEWGYPVVTGEVPAGLLAAARQAVLACPRRALRLSSQRVSIGGRRAG